MKATWIVPLLILTACGGNNAPDVASAGGEPGTPTAVVDVVTRYVEQRRAWVKCLREHGLEVTDPDPKGEVEFPNRPDKTDPTVMGAMEACKSLLAPVPEELMEEEEVTPELAQRRREYSKCMRDNGWPGFPDPDPDGRWPREEYSPPPEGQGNVGLRAQVICEPILEGGVANPSATPGPGLG